MPRTRSSQTVRFTIGEDHGYLIVGEYDDGRPGEVFVVMAKEGGTLRGMLDAWSRLFSVALQHGVALEDLVAKFSRTRFEPMGWSDCGLGFCSSIPDLVVRWLQQRYLPGAVANGEAEPAQGGQP
jgi:ribonucleoside-diphosphate reductase alpha chain